MPPYPTAHLSRRGFLAGSAAGAAALGIAACGGVSKKTGGAKTTGGNATAGAGSGTLTTQGFGKPDDVGQARIDAFKKAFPGVQLKINEGNFDPQQFLSAVGSGNPPGVVYLDRGLIGTFAAKGAIQPLDDWISKFDIKTSVYRPAALQDVTIDGKVYGIPEFYNSRNVLVNHKALAQAGVDVASLSTSDWNKLHTTARQLYKPKSGGIARIGFDPKLPEFLPLWAKANGADLVNSDGSPNLDDPKIVEALDYALGLIGEQGGWSKFKAFRDTWDLFGSGNQFVKDQAAAFPWEGWYVNVLVQASPNLDIAAIPFTDRKGQKISHEDGSAWCLPKGAPNAAAAVNWMKTITALDTWLAAGAAREQTVQKNKSVFTGLWTANTEADQQVRAKYVKPSGHKGFDDAITDYYASTEYAFSIRGSRAGSEIKTAWMDAANRALSGEKNAAATMKQAQAEASKAYTAAK